MRVLREAGSSEGVLRVVVVRGGKEGLRGDILCGGGLRWYEILRFVMDGRDCLELCEMNNVE